MADTDDTTTEAGQGPSILEECERDRDADQAGSAPIASSITVRWSSPSFAPARPSRSRPARGSPAGSMNEHRMEPEPTLEVRRCPSVCSEGTSNSDASTSMATGSSLSSRPSSREVAAARASRNRESVAASSPSNMRHTVESEATSPNSDGRLRNTATSVTHLVCACRQRQRHLGQQSAPVMLRAALHRGPHRRRKPRRQLEQLGDTADKTDADLPDTRSAPQHPHDPESPSGCQPTAEPGSRGLVSADGGTPKGSGSKPVATSTRPLGDCPCGR